MNSHVNKPKVSCPFLHEKSGKNEQFCVCVIHEKMKSFVKDFKNFLSCKNLQFCQRFQELVCFVMFCFSELFEIVADLKNQSTLNEQLNLEWRGCNHGLVRRRGRKWDHFRRTSAIPNELPRKTHH